LKNSVLSSCRNSFPIEQHPPAHVPPEEEPNKIKKEQLPNGNSGFSVSGF